MQVNPTNGVTPPEGVRMASFLQCGHRNTKNCKVANAKNQGIMTNIAFSSPAKMSEIGTPLKKQTMNRALRVFMRIVSFQL